MRSFLNRHSYYLLSLLALGGAGLIGGRFGAAAGSAAVAGVGAVLAFTQARLSSRSSFPDWAAVQGAIHSGRPALLFIFADT